MKVTFIVLALVFLVASCSSGKKEKGSNEEIQLLVIAGGHAFDTADFVDIFRSFKGIRFDTLMQPHANRVIADGGAASYDAIVFYDMWEDADSMTKQSYLDLCRKGTGMVFLHHSLVSYQHWPEFEELTGGRYVTGLSGEDSTSWSDYRHDIDLNVHIVEQYHSVTRGVEDFLIHDEGYTNIRVSENVDPLLICEHPDCNRLTGWTHVFKNSRIVYFLYGHDKTAYENASFRKLLEQAIRYVSG